MNRRMPSWGFCPTLNKERSIDICYIGITSLNDIDRRYTKGMFDCGDDSFSECPLAKECPIYTSAPERI